MSDWAHFTILWIIIVGLGIGRGLLFLSFYLQAKLKQNQTRLEFKDSKLLLYALFAAMFLAIAIWWQWTPCGYMYGHPEVEMSYLTYLLLCLQATSLFLMIELYTPELSLIKGNWDLERHYYAVVKPAALVTGAMFLITLALTFFLAVDLRPSFAESLRTNTGGYVLLAFCACVAFATYWAKSERAHFFCQTGFLLVPLLIGVVEPHWGQVDRDTDMDGVHDVMDRCPSTLADETFDVDLYGCSPRQNAESGSQEQ